MKKLAFLAIAALTLPAAASASINLSAAVVSVNKDVAITSGDAFGAGNATSSLTALDTPCFGGACGDPVSCTSSPENPTALLAVLGATGLLLGRFGFTHLRERRSTVAIAA